MEELRTITRMNQYVPKTSEFDGNSHSVVVGPDRGQPHESSAESSAENSTESSGQSSDQSSVILAD